MTPEQRNQQRPEPLAANYQTRKTQQAVGRIMLKLLAEDLPPVTWRINPHVPTELVGQIHYESVGQVVDAVTEWADYFGTVATWKPYEDEGGSFGFTTALDSYDAARGERSYLTVKIWGGLPRAPLGVCAGCGAIHDPDPVEAAHQCPAANDMTEPAEVTV